MAFRPIWKKRRGGWIDSLGALVRIVLPLARQGIAATTVFIAIGAWNEYVRALLLTTANGARTWPVGLQLMVGEFQMPWGV